MQDKSANKANGYNRDLYRNPRKGMIAGICAGLADYYGIPVWVARLIGISLFIFVTQLFVIAYVVGIFLLAKRPHRGATDENSSDRSGRKEHKIFEYQKPASQRLRDIHDRIRALEKKLRSMEGYITSNRYKVNRDISEL